MRLKHQHKDGRVLTAFILLLIIELVVIILLQSGMFDVAYRFAIHSIHNGFKTDEASSPVLGPVTNVLPPPALAEETIPLEDAPLKNLGDVKYIEIVESCAHDFSGGCVAARSGPGTKFERLENLRNGMVLRVTDEVSTDEGLWYKVVFDEWLRYPERISGEWYISAQYASVFYDEGEKVLSENVSTSSTKIIVIDRSQQRLYASEADELFMEAVISTGKELTPTPRGEFTLFKKIPSRYMQGPLPYLVDQQIYDLPGVPWTLYFTDLGAAIHGAYWHENFGNQHSHGCVNLTPEEAKKLYSWAELNTKIIVKD